MYRDHNLFDLCEHLKHGTEEPIPEALIWYLFTGQIPDKAQVKATIDSMHKRSEIPMDVEKL